MANGEILKELQKLLEGHDTLPQEVTNRLILASIQQMYQQINKLQEDISKIKEAMNIDKVMDKEQHKDFIRFSVLWDEYGRDIVKLLIAAILGYLLAKVGLNL